MAGAPTFDDEPFGPTPPESEPPEGDLELALQEEALGTDALAPPAEPPPVVGRTYALDLRAGRLLPEGRQPVSINGEAAMRQAIEKCLRTDRGAAEVHTDQYGREDASDDLQGQPFDSAAFAVMEAHVRDALLALPWVLDVQEFDADGGPGSTEAVVSFRVVPEGDAEPIEFNRYPLPIA